MQANTTDASAAIKVLATTAGLDDGIQVLIEDSQTVAEAIDVLVESGEVLDAIRLLGQAVSLRTLCWWGVLGAWHSQGADRHPAERALLRAIFDWLRDPSDALAERVQTGMAPISRDRDVHHFARMTLVAQLNPSDPEARKAGVAGLFAVAQQRRHKARDAFYADLLSIGKDIVIADRHWADELHA